MDGMSSSSCHKDFATGSSLSSSVGLIKFAKNRFLGGNSGGDWGVAGK